MTGRLRLDDLQRKVGDFLILDRFSLRVEPGQIVGIVGPSGAGKSSLVRVLAGLDSLDAGEIYLDDVLINDRNASRRGLGVVFQDDPLWPHLRVEEILEYGMKVQRESQAEIRMRVTELLSLFALESVARWTPDRLTREQQVRVSLARAWSITPPLVLLDEPLEPIEPARRPEFIERIRQWHRNLGSTTLLFSRSPELLLSLCDQMVLIDLGRAVQSGTPEAIYRRPVDPFVARSLGEVNLYQAQVESIPNPARPGELIVRSPLGRLLCTQAEGRTPGIGEAVTLAIRPEAPRLEWEPSALGNRIPVTVERVRFQGSHYAIDLRSGSRWPIQMTAALIPDSLQEGQCLSVTVGHQVITAMVSGSSTDQAKQATTIASSGERA